MTDKITHQVQISSEKDAFTNSREALATLLKQEGLDIQNLKSDLELINFQHLKKFPDFVLSLSHTKDAGAAVLARKSEVISIGIDIEWNDRMMKPGTEKFYRNQEDSFYPDNIELWTMKEAAFKALSPVYTSLDVPGVLVLSKIIIKEGVFYTQERPAITGTVSTHFFHSNERKMVISIARILSESFSLFSF